MFSSPIVCFLSFQDEKLPLDNSRRKSDVLVVLENNRNGRTKCYSTSAAALNGPKPGSKNQSPVKVVPVPPQLPSTGEPLHEAQQRSPMLELKPVVALPKETNGVSQQTNGLPSSPPPLATILEGAYLAAATATPNMLLGSESSAPTLLNKSIGGCCKEAVSSAHYQRNETSI